MNLSSELERIQGLPIWDADRRRELEALGTVLGKSDYIVELWEVFEASWQESLGEWNAAFTVGDKHKLRALAHRFKGSAGSVGTQKLHSYFAMIQQVLDQPSLSESEFGEMFSAGQKAQAFIAETKGTLKKI